MIEILKAQRRNCIYLTVLGLAILGSIIMSYMGRGQDQNYLDNYRRYQQASLLIGQGEYASAQEILGSLEQDFQGSYQVQYRLGICAAALGNFDQAVMYMQKVREVRPAVLQEHAFLLDFGRVLFLQGDYELARQYLQESKKYGANQDAAAQVNKILQQIDDKRKAVSGQ